MFADNGETRWFAKKQNKTSLCHIIISSQFLHRKRLWISHQRSDLGNHQGREHNRSRFVPHPLFAPSREKTTRQTHKTFVVEQTFSQGKSWQKSNQTKPPHIIDPIGKRILPILFSAPGRRFSITLWCWRDVTCQDYNIYYYPCENTNSYIVHENLPSSDEME